MKDGSVKQASRWMALDVGTKAIGVALSDPLKLTAQPLTTIRRRELEADAGAIMRLVERHNVDRCIVGHPRHLDGRPSRTLSAIQPLAERLAQAPGLCLQWYDERLSTREAEATMGELGLPLNERRRRRNEFAAAMILKWYLDETRAS